MGKQDPRVDAYIAKAAPFARPILTHLRRIVHRGCPEVEEKIKWGFPHFDYHGMYCSMAAFKTHCAFGFWKSALLKERYGKYFEVDEKAMGQFGRITSLSLLPLESTLLAMVRAAARINAEGSAPARKPRPKPKPAIPAPDSFLKALARNKKAKAAFEAFTPGQRREYLEWITEARGEATRERRLKQAIEWMSEGKTRNWKYKNC